MIEHAHQALPTPTEIAASITADAHLEAHLPADVLLQLQALISAAIERERPAAAPVSASPAEASVDAEPWVMPGDPLEDEPGFYVMFGDTCVQWEQTEDAAYMTIGLLLRHHGDAAAARQAVLDEEAKLAAKVQFDGLSAARTLGA
ncbi:MAG TPA: hypothetical protein VGE07_29745 [Herpetosiphonaceae bacterium]